VVRSSLSGTMLLAASFAAAACPLCGDSQGYSSPQQFVARQRPTGAASSGGVVTPPVVDPIRDRPPTAIPLRLDRNTAASAVLALAGERGARLRVIEVIRGEMPADGVIDPAWVVGLDRDLASGPKPLLLIRARTWQSWAVVGAIGAEHAGWLRQLAAAKASTEMSDAEWDADVAFMLPYLESTEPMVAEMAYGELARAPYTALRSLKGSLDLTALRRWTADPRLEARQSLYTLLLGVGGDAVDAAHIEQRLDAAWQAKDVNNLGPLLAASLELQGSPRMDWIDTKYIADRDRTQQELQAILLALSVQGGASAAVPRERVIESYRLFIAVHAPLAGFVAQDLAAWNCWDAVPAYIALLRSDSQQLPASRYAMLSYLRQSPRPDAKAAIAALAAAGK